MSKQEITHILFESTEECNLSCKFCYNIWKNDSYKNNASKVSYKHTIRTLKALIKRSNINSITFTGGEPLKTDRFSEIVLFCRLRNIEVSILSNGTFGSLEDYATLNSLGVSAYQFTVLSHNHITHDDLTRVEGSLAKTVQIITFLINQGKDVGVTVVLNKTNCDDIKFTLEYIKHLGVTQIMLNRFNIGGAGIQNVTELMPSKDQLNKAFYDANEFVNKHDIEITSNVCTPYCILNPRDFSNISFVDCLNSELNDKPFTLDNKGNLRICNHSPHVIGNVLDNKITDLINNDYVKSWENIVPDHCKDCNNFASCRSGCRGASEQIGKSISSADPLIDIIN